MTHPVIVRLSKLKNGIPESVQAGIGTATRRSAKFTGICLGALSAILLISVAALYLRLLQGPISMDYVVPVLERAVNSQLPNASLDIGGAVIRLSENKYDIEFRLKDVSLLDEGRAPVAQAPFASIGLSVAAFLQGHMAAGQINFIEPKLVASYSEDKGLSLSFSTSRNSKAAAGKSSPSPGQLSAADARDDTPQENQGANNVDEPAADVTKDVTGQINLVELLNTLFDKARQGSATSYLTQFGIKQATVYFDHGDRFSKWLVPEASIELKHLKKFSVLSGKIMVASGAKPWRLDFKATQNRRKRGIELSATVADITPSALAEDISAIPALKYFDLPITLTANASMLKNGDIADGALSVNLGKGLLYSPWDKKHPAAIDSGQIRLAYAKKQEKIELLSADLRWGDSRLGLKGSASRVTAPDGRHSWAFDIYAPEVALGVDEFNLPPIHIDTLAAKGNYDPTVKTLVLDRFQLQAADAGITLKGTVGTTPESGGVKLNGQITPMPLTFLKILWPEFVAHGARDWIGKNVLAGRINGGTVKVALSPQDIENLRNDGDVPDEAVSLHLDLSNLIMNHIKGLSPLKVERGTASLIGRRFIFDAPEEGTIDLPSGAKVNLNSGQFIVADVRPHIPYGEIHFKASGDAAAVAELLDEEPLAYVRKGGFKRDMLSGTVTGSFSLGMPMAKDLKFSDISLRGKAKLENVRATGLESGIGIHGGTIAFDITEKAIEAQGDLKANGVPVQLAWQRIFDAPPEVQPRIRLRAILDERARDEFGIAINHFVKGNIPTQLSIGLKTGAPPDIGVEADLTNADLFLVNLGWRKQPGLRATLFFDVVRDNNNRIKLDNLRLLGDDITINGSLTLNEQRKPAAFQFPNFSFNLLTKLSISGVLTAQNNWKVDVRGASYDGRQFFRSLFSAGQLAENQPSPPKNEPGADVHAEIDTVIGYFDTTVKNVVIDARKRGGKLVALEINGRLNGNAPAAARLDVKPGQPRMLLAEATDAGAAFRVVGFYPAVRGGEASLKVNLDGEGAAEKKGTLFVQNFTIVGDQVVEKVVNQAPQGKNTSRQRGTNPTTNAVSGSQIDFDRMVVPFAVGHGQFVLLNSAINGPMLGATLRGRIDFLRDTISLSGTYVPLYGINAAIAPVPLIGDLLTGGRQGEGIFGITFAVQGQVSKPDVIVNPMSLMTPGFLRGIMEFNEAPPKVIPAPETPKAPQTQSSSQPPVIR